MAVVYRSNNNANANGGVSYANANNGLSNANTNIGVRLEIHYTLDRPMKLSYRDSFHTQKV